MAICSRSAVQNTNNWQLEIRKTNTLLNLTPHQPVIEKIYLYAKVLHMSKYQLLIKIREDAG